MRARVEFRALKPGMLQLCALEAPQETVLDNVLIDSKPLIGRSRLQLQYLWPDIAGRCSTVQVDYMPCVASPCVASPSPSPSRFSIFSRIRSISYPMLCTAHD